MVETYLEDARFTAFLSSDEDVEGETWDDDTDEGLEDDDLGDSADDEEEA